MTSSWFFIYTIKTCIQVLKNPTIIETIRLNRLRRFGHVQRTEEGKIPKRISYMNLETTRLIGGPRNRWQDEVREDGRIVVWRMVAGKSTLQRGMEEAAENGKESAHSARANGTNG